MRPQVLLASLHDLVILLSLRLVSSSTHLPSIASSTAATTPFDTHQRDRRSLDGVADFLDELSGDISSGQEIFDKVRGMEGKLEYQIKKLIGLADAEEKRGREVIEDAEEGVSSACFLASIRILTPQIHYHSDQTRWHLLLPPRASPQLLKADQAIPMAMRRKATTCIVHHGWLPYHTTSPRLVEKTAELLLFFPSSLTRWMARQSWSRPAVYRPDLSNTTSKLIRYLPNELPNSRG